MKKIVDVMHGWFLNDFWGKIIKNVVVIVTGTSLSSVFSMISTFAIIWILTPNDYGSFVVGQTYMSIIDALVNFQSWQGVIRYGAFAVNEKNDEKLLATIKAGLCIDILTCVLGTIIGLIVIRLVGIIFKWSNTVVFIGSLFSLEIAFHIEGTINGFLRLMNKFNYVAIFTGFTGFLKFAIVLLLFAIKVNDVIIFTAFFVIGDIIKYTIFLLIAAYMFHKEYGIKKLCSVKIKEVDREFWQYTFWSNLTATVDVPIKYFDIIFLSLISNEKVAAYNLFKKSMGIFGMLISPISQVIMPQFSELVATGKEKDALKKMRELRNMLFWILVPCMFAFSLIFPFILDVVGQRQYLDYIYIMPMLAIYNVCAFSYVGIHPLFNAYGFSKDSTKIILIANLIYVGITLLLIKRLQVIGIIVGEFIQFLVVIVWKQRIIKKRFLVSK